MGFGGSQVPTSLKNPLRLKLQLRLPELLLNPGPGASLLFVLPKSMIKNWCLGRTAVLQLEDTASCYMERKLLNKRLICFTGFTGI